MLADPLKDIQGRLRDGDAVALDLIYDRFAPLMRAFARGIVGGERADDVVHDVLIAVAEHAERVAEAADLTAYLMRMVRNRALDLLRRRSPPSRPIHDGDAWLAPDDHDGAGDGERARTVAAALDALPPDQREVVVLKVWSDLTFVAIGEVLGIPANTAASRYRYALAKLQPLLEDDHAR